MMKAQSREEAEGMLRNFVQESGGDSGYQIADQVAKSLGIRPPWHRDFNAPPGEQMGADMGPSGRPRPLQRGGY